MRRPSQNIALCRTITCRSVGRRPPRLLPLLLLCLAGHRAAAHGQELAAIAALIMVLITGGIGVGMGLLFVVPTAAERRPKVVSIIAVVGAVPLSLVVGVSLGLSAGPILLNLLPFISPLVVGAISYFCLQARSRRTDG